MSNTYYTSLTGMTAASYGLQNTSNNVANMQSPGFKRTDLFYSSLGGSNGQDNLGSGVCIGGSSTNFSAGNYLPTGNPSDLAILGQGFFMIRLKNGELRYTRDGEFNFDKEGLLVDKHSGGIVQSYNEFGDLVPIEESGPKKAIGKATKFIDLAGDFVLIEKKKEDSTQPPSPGLPSSKYENIHFKIVNIYDDKGKEHEVYLEFKAKDPINNQDIFDGLNWELVSLTCDGNPIDFKPQTIQFTDVLSGLISDTENAIHFTLNGSQDVTLNFGDHLSESDKSVHLKKQDASNSATSIKISQQDGFREGSQVGFSFDENGQISYHYDNEQSVKGHFIALAKFDDMEHSLIAADDNLFRCNNDYGRHFDRANKSGFGRIQSKKLESSNVDSTTEFANIVVLQRMFQACSQIMDIDKQLVEELYKK